MLADRFSSEIRSQLLIVADMIADETAITDRHRADRHCREAARRTA
jgi:hypothetical protein